MASVQAETGFCSECGSRFSEAKKFCASCGAAVIQADTSSSQALVDTRNKQKQQKEDTLVLGAGQKENKKEFESIKGFAGQSTWDVWIAGVFTLNIYGAHYIKRQTNKINEITDDKSRISIYFINVLFVMSYMSVILLVTTLFIDDIEHPVEMLSFMSSWISRLLLIIWGFKARNRINSIYDTPRESDKWFKGFWTFLFPVLYFNYKVNRICRPDSS